MIRWTAILIISLALAATAGAYEYLGPNNYGSSNLTLAGTDEALNRHDEAGDRHGG
jgi:hypothetical protein